MANNRVVVKFLADTDNMRKGINQVNTQLGSFGKAVKSAGIALAATFGAREVKDFLSGAITSFASLEEAVSKTNVVFGESADEIATWARKQSDALAMTETAALQYVSTLGSILVQSGLTQQEAGKLSQQLTVLVADLASFSDVPIEQAFNAVKGAIVGEREALKSLGFVITEAEVKTKALNLGLIKQGEELTANAKAQANIAVLMDKTSQAQGDMERTGDSLANQMKKLNAEASELQTFFGKGLVQGFGDTRDTGEDLLGTLKRLQPTMEDLGEAVGEQLADWGELFGAVADLDESVRALTASFGDGESGIISWGLKLQELIAPIGKVTKALGGVLNAITAVNNAFTNSRTTRITPGYGTSDLYSASNTKNIEKQADAVAYFGSEVGYTKDNVTKWTLEQRRLQEALEDTGGSVGGSTKKVKEGKKAWEEYAEVLGKDIKEKLAEAEDTFRSWRDRVVGYLDINKAFQQANDAVARRDQLQIELDSLRSDPEANKKAIAELEAQLAEAGADAGKTWVQRFTEQITNTTNFARQLGNLKEQGLNQTLIDQISGMGADAGSQLANEILSDKNGMIGTLNAQVKQVEDAGVSLGLTMVNTAGPAGKDYGMKFLYGEKKDGSMGLLPVIERDKKKVKKKIREALNTTVEVKVRYVPDYSAIEGSTNPYRNNAVRSVQNYERLNGSKWRDRVR